MSRVEMRLRVGGGGEDEGLLIDDGLVVGGLGWGRLERSCSAGGGGGGAIWWVWVGGFG